MSCDTEMYQEEYSETWTADEIAAMEAESKLLQAKAEQNVVRMANERGWSREYFTRMRRDAMARAKEQAHQNAHDRHFLRQVNERAAWFEDAEAVPAPSARTTHSSTQN